MTRPSPGGTATAAAAMGLLAAAMTLPACEDPGEPSRTDADGEPAADVGESDASDARDAPVDGARGDGEGGDTSAPSSGPITLVAEDFGATERRLCDHDGDGQLDNAIADLGSPNAGMLAMAINSFIASAYATENDPVIVHFPWIEDLDAPSDGEAVMLVFRGVDDEVPRDRTDDYSGEEPFEASVYDLDDCGEPKWAFPGTTIVDGVLETTEDSELSVPLGTRDLIRLLGAEAFGVLQPRGTAGDFELCGYSPIAALGGIDSLVVEDASLLELLLSGGRGFGLSTLPGLTPDVDVDGDGLEQIELDDAGLIERCVDGDSTPIPGRDCWQDERIADAFGLVLELATVPAVFAGPERGATGLCTEPPDESLWEPR